MTFKIKRTWETKPAKDTSLKDFQELQYHFSCACGHHHQWDIMQWGGHLFTWPNFKVWFGRPQFIWSFQVNQCKVLLIHLFFIFLSVVTFKSSIYSCECDIFIKKRLLGRALYHYKDKSNDIVWSYLSNLVFVLNGRMF